MYPAVVERLRCPVCRSPLSATAPLTERGTATAPGAERGGAGCLRCPAGHAFDLARQGYADLTGGRATHPGDTAEMVAARQTLLGGGHLDVVTAAGLAAVPAGARGAVLDVGAGTGHHLARILDARPGLAGLAVDVSKPALRRAARAHPRLAAVRADVWRGLPVADAGFDIVLDVFAPRSGGEFHRVLRPDGRLVVVTPAPGHLAELVTRLGLLAVDPDKDVRLSAALTPWFDRDGGEERTAALRLSRAEAAALVLMGPSAWHVPQDRLADGLAALDEPVTATAAVRTTVWRPRGPRSREARTRSQRAHIRVPRSPRGTAAEGR